MKQAKSSSKYSTPLTVFQMNPLRQAIREAVRSRQSCRECVAGVVAATLISLGSPAFGQILELSDLDGSNGFKINGETAGDSSGASVSSAGDVNGDGIDDVIIGATRSGSSTDKPGASYVVFGRNQGINTPLELSSLDGINGFKINGVLATSSLPGNDYTGRSVSGAGDINGDGIADVVIGADRAQTSATGNRPGAGYLVFGSDLGFSDSLELSSLNGTNGLRLNGDQPGDNTGYSVSAAGDVNGDGLDDLIIGAYTAAPNGRYNSGASYVLFGTDQGFSNSLELSDRDGTDGFVIIGETEYNYTGWSVSTADDINGDSIADIVIGTVGGFSYLVFGSNQGFSGTLDLYDLDGKNGFKLTNCDMSSGKGCFGVSRAGDLNGDGFGDIIIGAYLVSHNGMDGAGASYVVFGSGQGFSSTLDLSSLNGNNGFKVFGEAQGDYSGSSVSAAGDVNDDGIDDIIIGASGADPNGNQSGSSYVVFGSLKGFSSELELSNLDGSNGFKLSGEAQGEFSGRSVSAAGDVNGDGIDDLIIGAPDADPNGNNSGASYVVFGSPGIGQKIESSQMISSLGDIDNDGNEDIAVLIHDVMANPVTATIIDAEDGSLIQAISFDGNLKPVDFKHMADINANGAPELVVLGQGQGLVNAEVRDSLTGALIGSVDFDLLEPVELEIVPDQNSNRIPELAVLNDNPVQVEVRDALTGNMVSTVSYTDNITPMDLLVLPDLNGKGGPEMGVLGEYDNPDKNDRVELRDLFTGKWVRNLTYGKLNVSQAQVVSDLNNNGTPEVVVLRTTDGRVNLLIRDATNNAFVRGYGFDPNYVPGKLLVVPDVNGNNASEIAVFGKNPSNQTQKAQIKDGKTKKAVRNVFFNKAFEPDDLVVIPDMNGNGAAEIGLLGTRSDNGLIRLIIKDSKSGALVGTVNF